MSRRYQGVTAFVGMPGSAKTYALTEVCMRAQRRGLTVWANAGYEPAGARVIRSFEDFTAITGPAVICFDELPLYFNARKWAEFPDALLYKLSQIRKDGLELYYTAIHEQMVDVTLRRITFWYWQCRALPLGFFARSLWPPETFRRKMERPFRRELFRLRRPVLEAYDTMAKVAVVQKTAERYQDLGSHKGQWLPVQPSGAPPGVHAGAGSEVGHGEAVTWA